MSSTSQESDDYANVFSGPVTTRIHSKEAQNYMQGAGYKNFPGENNGNFNPAEESDSPASVFRKSIPAELLQKSKASKRQSSRSPRDSGKGASKGGSSGYGKGSKSSPVKSGPIRKKNYYEMNAV